MKQTTRQDVEAPLDFVYQRLTDFDHFERMAMRRGAELERTDRLKTPGVGMAWRLRFTYRNKPRSLPKQRLSCPKLQPPLHAPLKRATSWSG